MLASPASECSDFSAGARNTAEASLLSFPQELTAERGSADFLGVRNTTSLNNGTQWTAEDKNIVQ